MNAPRFVFPSLVFLFLLGCDPQNTAKVGCQDFDCKASCLAKGLPDGSCQASGCVCAPWDTEEYAWPGKSSDPKDSEETDPSSGSVDTSSATETVEQTDSGSESTPETDSDTSSAVDSETIDSDSTSASSGDTTSSDDTTSAGDTTSA